MKAAALAAFSLMIASPALAGSETERSGFWTTGAAAVIHDDNVFALSPEDLFVQESVDFNVPGPDRDRFWRMRYISDTIIRTALGLYVQRHVTEDQNSQRFSLDMEYDKYVYNTIKDHPAFRGSMRQYFGERHYFEGALRYVPDQFDLNYLGRTRPDLRFPGFFTVLGAGLSWNGRFDRYSALELGVHLDYEEEKYREAELRYRNAIVHRGGGSLAYRWSPWFWTQGTYQFEQRRAARTSFNDRSEEQHQWGLSAEISPAPGWRIVPSYLGSFTHYTTDFDFAADPFHAGRRDYLDQYAALLGWRVSEHLDASLKYERSENRTNIKAQTSDERLRYVKNVLSVSAQTEWDIPALPHTGAVDIERRKETDQSGFWTSEGIAYSYDDNVHSLSPQDQEAWRTLARSALTPNHQRFNRMENIHDHISSYKAGLYEQSAPFGDGFAERLGMDLNYDKYSYNPIKDYSTLRASLRQYLTARHFLEAYYTAAPNQFDRNYLGQDLPATYFAGNFDSHRYGLLWDGLLDAFAGVDAGLKWEYDRNLFREPELRYRNSIDHVYGGRVGYHWLEGIYTEGRYQFEQAAFAHSKAIDPSYDRHQWTAHIQVNPWRALALTGEYIGSFSHYTSRLGFVDAFYAGRRDLLDRFLLRAAYTFWKHMELFTQYEHAENRSNIPYADTDERLRYVKNVYSLGASIHWDLGLFQWAFGSE